MHTHTAWRTDEDVAESVAYDREQVADLVEALDARDAAAAHLEDALSHALDLVFGLDRARVSSMIRAHAAQTLSKARTLHRSMQDSVRALWSMALTDDLPTDVAQQRNEAEALKARAARDNAARSGAPTVTSAGVVVRNRRGSA